VWDPCTCNRRHIIGGGIFSLGVNVFGSIAKASSGRHGVCIGTCVFVTLAVLEFVDIDAAFVTPSEPKTPPVLFDPCRIPT